MSAVIALGFQGVDFSTFELGSSCVAQTQPAQQVPPVLQKQQPDLEKAMKYHSALLSRPTPGYLYDRFYNAWLDSSSQEELKQFLMSRAEASDAKSADRLLLAFFYARQGKDVQALQQFRVALENNPDNAATFYEMAIIEARTLDFESALKNLTKAAQTNPSTEEVIKIAQLRGKLLIRNQQIEEAAKVWDELIKNNPNDLGLMEDLIELQISEGMFEQAKRLSDQLITKTNDPFQKVIRQLRKGDILQRAGRQTEALEVYGNTVAQVGMDTWIEREVIGQVEQLFRREDNLVGLNEYFGKLIQANSGRVAIRQARSKILMELGEVDEAIKAYEKIIELTPGSRENREAFTNLLIRAGKTDRAVKQMETLVAQHSKDAELQIRLAELCHKTLAPRKTKAALDKFIVLSGSTEYSYLRAARLFEKFKDLDSARAAHKTALATFEASDSVKESWADFLFRSGDKGNAVKVWQALAKDTDRAGLVRLARLVSVRRLNQVALDMLLARYDEFKLDSIYLGQLCTEAIALKKFQQAVPWATERVRLAKTSSDIETALPPAILIINSAKETESVIRSLRDKKDRSAVETCLLVEMLERSSLSDEAEKTLQLGFEASKAAKENQGIQILAKQRVRLARGRQNWVDAAKAARELLDLPGGRKSPNVRQLIELYVRAGDDNSALEWIAEWKRLSPGSLMPWLNEATLLERSGKTKASIAVLRRATQKFPDDPDLFGQLAQKYLSDGQTENAERIFWRQYEASEKMSDKIRWAEQLARIADDEGSVDQLVKNLEERRKNNPQSIEPLLSIAQVHRIAGNYEERRAALLEATRLKKDDLSLLLEIARLEESEGDWEKAIQTLEQASVLDKTNRAKQKIAQLFLQYGETKEGLNRLLEIAGGKNSTAADIEKISNSILRTENWEELLNFLTPHLDRFPDNYRLAFLVAIANEELGNFESAKVQFFELLRADQEFSTGVAKNNSINAGMGQLDYLRDTLPKTAIDLMDLLTVAPQVAYSYRRTDRQPGYGLVQSKTYLPKDLESCHKFALCHIGEIARDSPQEERDDVEAQLKLAGVENAKFLMVDLAETEFLSEPMALLDIDPDSEAALAIAAMSVVTNQSKLSQEIYLSAYERFKDSFPSISFFAAVNLDQTKSENEKRLAAAVRQLKAIDKPGYLIFLYVAQCSSQSTDSNESESIDRYRPELSQVLMDWYPKIAQSPQWSNFAFNTMVTSLSKEKSPKRLIELFDQELDRIKGQSKQQQAGYGYYGGYGGNQPEGIALPVYPPLELITFPSKIYAFLGMPRPDELEDSATFPEYLDDEKLWQDRVAIAVSTAKDPTMKVLLELKYFCLRSRAKPEPDAEPSAPAAPLPDSIKTAFGDKATDATSAIQQLLNESETNVDGWYLAGALAVKEERWDDAAASFETLRALPMTAGTRRMIDGNLVALATLGVIDDLQNEKHKQVVKSAKEAALRMRRGTLSQEQRVTLVAAFELLGLDDEAEKMESKIAKIAKLGGGSGGSASTVAIVDRITELTKAGKKNAAARLLAQEFKIFARQELDLDSMFENRHELREYTARVEALGLKKELLKQLDPGNSTNARKLGGWAIANEVFGSKTTAEATYKKLLESHPREDAARLRYVLVNSANAGQLFPVQFSKVRERFRTKFLVTIVSEMSQKNISGEDMLALAESIIDYKTGENGDSINDALFGYLVTVLADRMYIDANQYESVPMIYRKVVKGRSNTSKAEQRFADRRRILHDRVALWMTDSSVPGQAEHGFTALLAATEAADSPVGERFVKLALKTVIPAKTLKQWRRQQYSGVQLTNLRYEWGSNLEGYYVTQRTPVEFLARHYGFSEENHDQQIESIAEQLDSLKAEFDAAKLRNTYALCRASNDDFVSVVERLVKSAKGTAGKPDRVQWSQALKTALEVWTERKIQADISPLLIDFVTQETNQYTSDNGIPYQEDSELLVRYLREFSEVNDLPKVEELMTSIRLRMIGNEEEERELVKLLVDQPTIQKNMKKVVPAGNYYFLAKTLNTRKTFWLGMKESLRFTFPTMEYVVDPETVLEQMSSFEVTEVDSMLEWLRQSNVLAELDSFDPYYPTGDDSRKSVWGDVLKNLEYKYSKRLKGELDKQLSAKADLTFGEKLLLSFARRKPANIYQMIGSDIDTFSALPEEKQILLANFAKEIDVVNLYVFGSKQARELPESEESRAGKRKCFSLVNRSVRSEVAKLMKAKQFSDLGITVFQFQEWSLSLVSSIGVAYPEELLAAVDKISRISAERKLKEYVWQGEFPFKSRLIESVIAKDIYTDSVKAALDAFERDGFEDVNFSLRLSKSIGQYFRAQFSDAKNEMRKLDMTLSSPAGSVKAVQHLINQFGDEYGDREFRVLIPELRFVCMPMSNREARAVSEFLHSNEKTKYPKIKETFRLAFDCSRDLQKQWQRVRESREAPKRPVKTESYHKEILDFIDDDSIPLQSRSRVASHLIEYDTLSCVGVTTCTRVLAEAYDAGQSFEARLNERMLSALMLSDSAPGIEAAKFNFAKSWSESLHKRPANYQPVNVIYCIRMLDLGEDKTLVPKLLRVLELSNAPRVANELIELEYFDEAEKRYQAIWKGSKFISKSSFEAAVYTPKLESKLPVFLDRFEKEGEKYFVELYFASLRNFKDSPKLKTTSASRVKALADRYPDVRFRSKHQRQLSLILLSLADANLDAIETPLAEAVENLSVAEVFTGDNVGIVPELLGAYLSIQIQRQNFKPVQAKWKEINKLVDEDYFGSLPSDGKKALTHLNAIISDSLLRLLHDQTPEQIAEIVPVIRELSSPLYQQKLNPHTTEFAYLLTGQIDELEMLLKEQRSFELVFNGKKLEKPSNLNQFLSNYKEQYAVSEPVDPVARANFVTGVWQVGSKHGYRFGPDQFEAGALGPFHGTTKFGIEQFAKLGMLTDQEALDLGPKLAEINSVNGEIWVQLARRQVDAGLDLKAADSYRKSIEAATPKMKKAKLNRRVEYANTLVKLKRNKEAKEMIANISADQLFKVNKHLLKKLQDKLK